MSVKEELTQAKEMRAGWIAAEKAVMTGQEYYIGTRRLRRVDLKDIRKAINYWESEVGRLESGSKSRIRVQQVIPRDL